MALQTNLLSSFSPASSNLQDSISYKAGNIYTDVNGLSGLKAQAREDQDKALPEVARQFESIFISMMIKSMRQDGMEDPLLDSSSTDTFRGMYDQQMSIELSKGDGIGIAESIVRQLSKNKTMSPEAIQELHSKSELPLPQAKIFPDYYGGKELPLANIVENNKETTQNENISKALLEINKKRNEMVKEQNSQTIDRNLTFESPQDFVNTLWPLAEKSAQKLGIKPEVLLSQAALETGWGKAIIKNSQGTSFNLFNIKADKRWDGDKIAKISLEYEQGTPVNRKSYFRAYDNLQQSFDDYVKFIQNNPRYQKALENVSDSERYLHDIQKAGYATDPEYANKILRVMNSDTIQQNIKQTSVGITKT